MRDVDKCKTYKLGMRMVTVMIQTHMFFQEECFREFVFHKEERRIFHHRRYSYARLRDVDKCKTKSDIYKLRPLICFSKRSALGNFLFFLKKNLEFFIPQVSLAFVSLLSSMQVNFRRVKVQDSTMRLGEARVEFVDSELRKITITQEFIRGDDIGRSHKM